MPIDDHHLFAGNFEYIIADDIGPHVHLRSAACGLLTSAGCLIFYPIHWFPNSASSMLGEKKRD